MVIYAVGILDDLMDRLAMMMQQQNDNVMPVRVAAELEDVRRSINGDSDAYKRLIEQHQDYVAKILWRFSRNQDVHEELVQDTFVEAYFSLHSFSRKAPLAHWLARIATRVGYRYWKQTAAEKIEPIDFEKVKLFAQAKDDISDSKEAGEIVHELLAILPPRDRLVLTLRYLEDCDVAETARQTGWSRVMVKVQTMRAKAKLKKLLSGYFEVSWEKDL